MAISLFYLLCELAGILLKVNFPASSRTIGLPVQGMQERCIIVALELDYQFSE